MPPDREPADWLAALDASLQALGTAVPFPPPPIPEQPARAPSEPDRNGAHGNGCDGIPADRVVEAGSGSDNPLLSKGLPALPAIPAPEKSVDAGNEIDTGMSRFGSLEPQGNREGSTNSNTGLMRARVNSKSAGIAGIAGSPISINALSLPDPLPEYPQIGYSVTTVPNPSASLIPDMYEERAAIMEYDGELSRAEAEAQAFAACIAWTCGAAASAEDQLRAADDLKALGLTPPPRWRPC